MSGAADFIIKIDNAFEALRVSYIALLAAANQAEVAGDKKSMRFYDERAEQARLALLDIGVGSLLPDRQSMRKMTKKRGRK